MVLFAEEVFVVEADGVALAEVRVGLAIPAAGVFSGLIKGVQATLIPPLRWRSPAEFNPVLTVGAAKGVANSRRPGHHDGFAWVDLAVDNGVAGINLQAVVTDDVAAVGGSVANAEGDRALFKTAGVTQAADINAETFQRWPRLDPPHSLPGRCHRRW